MAPILDPDNIFWVYSLLGPCGKFYKCKKIMFCCLLSHSARKQVRCYWSLNQWWCRQKPFCLRSLNHPLLILCENFCDHMGIVRLSKKRRFQSAVSRCSFSSRKHPILTNFKDWCFNWKPRFLIIRGLSVNKSICSARFRSTSADHILYNSAWIWLCLMIISVS